MNYKTFLKYNERSKAMNGKHNVIYLNEVKLLRKNKVDDLYELRAATNNYDSDEIIPKKAYCVRADNLTDYFWGTPIVLLSSLYLRVICGECWVINPEMLDEKAIENKIEILPECLHISVNFNDNERLLYIKVDEVYVAACGLAELLEEDAVNIIQQKALKNLRAYGVITSEIEDKLLDRIEKFLNSEEFGVYKKAGIGVLE